MGRGSGVIMGVKAGCAESGPLGVGDVSDEVCPVGSCPLGVVQGVESVSVSR